jgi:hypothetical protein
MHLLGDERTDFEWMGARCIGQDNDILSEFVFLTGFELMFVELGIATEVQNVIVKI